jgi:hypothetical protein
MTQTNTTRTRRPHPTTGTNTSPTQRACTEILTCPLKRNTPPAHDLATRPEDVMMPPDIPISHRPDRTIR